MAKISERDLAQAIAHPRGTEVRVLGPYRAALRDPAAYALLSPDQRDTIVRWAEIRRRIAARGVDRDAANLADPLADRLALRALVIAGELASGGRRVEDDGGDLVM